MASMATIVCLLWFLGILHQEEESKTESSECDIKRQTKDQSRGHLYLEADSRTEQVLLQVQTQRHNQSVMQIRTEKETKKETETESNSKRFQWPKQSGVVEQARKNCSPINRELEETLKECGILRRMIGEEEEEVKEGRVDDKARMS